MRSAIRTLDNPTSGNKQIKVQAVINGHMKNEINQYKCKEHVKQT